MAPLYINELLCFIATQADKLDRNSIFCTIVDFYTLDELIAAKSILINECDTLGLSDEIADFKKRRQNGKETANLKIVKDILDIWDTIDTHKAGITTQTFVAGDPNRLPSVDANKYNLKFLITSVLSLQEQLSRVSNVVAKIDQRIETSAAPRETLNASSGASLDAASPTLHSPASPRRNLPFAPAEQAADPRRSLLSAKRRLNSSASHLIPEKQKRVESPGTASISI